MITMTSPIIQQVPGAVNFTYNAVVQRVVDGDTLLANADLGFNTWRQEKFRLAHINCPEMSTLEGKAVKEFVISWVAAQKSFVLMSHGQDKYGRWVATIWGDDRTKPLNQILIDTGRAVPYM